MGGAVLTCADVAASFGEVAQADLKSLLPDSSPWKLDGGTPISAAAVGADGGRCVVSVFVRRNALVYVVQTLVPLILIGLGALLALNMNPEAPPLVGARHGGLIFGMVLLTLKSSNKDLGLGSLTYLIWVDYLRVLQFVLLMVGLIESAYVHHLLRSSNRKLALNIDAAARTLLPWVIYPYMVGCLILIGHSYVNAGIALMVIGVVLIITGSVWTINRKMAKGLRGREDVAKRLRAADLTDPESSSLLEEAFDIFDTDNSGTMSKKELHVLTASLFPKLRRSQVSTLVGTIHREGSLYEAGFDDFAAAVSGFFKPDGEAAALLGAAAAKQPPASREAPQSSGPASARVILQGDIEIDVDEEEFPSPPPISGARASAERTISSLAPQVSIARASAMPPMPTISHRDSGEPGAAYSSPPKMPSWYSPVSIRLAAEPSKPKSPPLPGSPPSSGRESEAAPAAAPSPLSPA